MKKVLAKIEYVKIGVAWFGSHKYGDYKLYKNEQAVKDAAAELTNLGARNVKTIVITAIEIQKLFKDIQDEYLQECEDNPFKIISSCHLAVENLAKLYNVEQTEIEELLNDVTDTNRIKQIQKVFDDTMTDIIADDPCDRSSEDTRYYEAVEATAIELNITEEEVEEAIWDNKF